MGFRFRILQSGDKSVSATADIQASSLPSAIPYRTARIFAAQSTYKFPVNATSRYILRFHFYPSSYPNFNIKDSFFSVAAGPLRLMDNFSTYLTAQALTQAYIVKEYSLAAVQTNTLTVTFKPSKKCAGSFAFVNGIELIPEPLLFDDKAEYVTGDADYSKTFDVTKADMQLMYRLNVGGQYIPPMNDSGCLMRSWYDDTAYIFEAHSTVTSIANVTVDYKGLMPQTAPLNVYRTCRSLGPDSNVNQQFNLTWILRADANCTYLVRLHFCDFLNDKINQMVFKIFLNNQTAITDADVIGWVGAKAAPIRKDYVVYLKDTPGDDYMWVSLHSNLDTKPELYNALLNGLEVFKISDSKSNLAGPNPTISEITRNNKV